MKDNYGMNDYMKFIHTSRYARWLEAENRRETWTETVDRYMTNIVGDMVPTEVYESIREAILHLEIMPSMRALMTAGEAATRDNTCTYNCAYLAVDNVKSFDEAMFILLCGTGVGFSVERQSIQKLPNIPKLYNSDTIIKVKDSKEGWAKSLRQLIALLYSGEVPKYDTGLVRPAGAKLKIFGGRASGPAPLEKLFEFTIRKFRDAEGGKLTSIQVHDIMCKIGEVVVVGGVRRSAMISLSNLSDDRMRHAKSGQWWESDGQRALANNSICYTEKPDIESFMREWTALVESKSGERGIFNREASIKQVEKNGRRLSALTTYRDENGNIVGDPNNKIAFGTNPCSEIILRPNQFCNLTEVVIKDYDTEETLKDKVKLASILGTIQSTYTYFPYLRDIWRKNTEEERLLGVSLTGCMDNPITVPLRETEMSILQEELKEIVIETNRKYAFEFGIPQSVATTCNKPSGTVSQLVDSASGIHARFAEFYVRTVRGDNKDPLTEFMKDMGIPWEPAFGKEEQTTVFSFPMKSPEGSVKRNDMSAIRQLEVWLIYQRSWCEHKPSVTINVKDEEWMEVGAFVYKHFDEMSGVSFLPYDGGSYKQAPYQEIDEKEYNERLAAMPESIDWTLLSNYEMEDTTKGSQTMACSGSSCELVDI